nr:hypothetical protein [Stenotrophobium rhamnosiphilum]
MVSTWKNASSSVDPLNHWQLTDSPFSLKERMVIVGPPDFNLTKSPTIFLLPIEIECLSIYAIRLAGLRGVSVAARSARMPAAGMASSAITVTGYSETTKRRDSETKRRNLKNKSLKYSKLNDFFAVFNAIR